MAQCSHTFMLSWFLCLTEKKRFFGPLGKHTSCALCMYHSCMHIVHEHDNGLAAFPEVCLEVGEQRNSNREAN